MDAEKDFFSLNSNELIALNLLLTVALSHGLDANQLNVLGNFICALGQNMLVIQARISALPGDARYMLHGEQICADDSGADGPDAATLENELQKCQERLTALEKLLRSLGLEETQNQPDQHGDPNPNQRDR